VKTLEDQLADYGSQMREDHGPVPAPEFPSTVRAARVVSRTTPQRRTAWPALAGGLTVVLVLGLLGFLARGGSSPDVGTPPTTAAPAPNIAGIPPAGTPPSDQTPGEVVLTWGSSISRLGEMWVYADGRVISSGPLEQPTDAGDEFIGLAERRLTPEGVDYLRNEVLASGLFEGDLLLAREGDAPYLTVSVLDGDRMVSVTWAWRGIAGDAPVATPEQVAALEALNRLFAYPGVWPTDLWQEQTRSAYVPAEYSICFGLPIAAGDGTWLGATDPERVWALLPQAAQTLLRAGEARGAEWAHSDGGCSRMSTDDARSLAQILIDAGIPRPSGPTELALVFQLQNQTIVSDAGLVGNEVWIQFCPVFPDGVAVWLGPG
jgi:hypothetical protein